MAPSNFTCDRTERPLSFETLELALQRLIDYNTVEDSRMCVITLLKLLDKILLTPNEPKVRQIRVSNPNFRQKVGSLPGGMEYLLACGFEAGGIGDDERLLLVYEDTPHLIKARQYLRTRAIQDLSIPDKELPVLPVVLPTSPSFNETKSDSPVSPPLTPRTLLSNPSKQTSPKQSTFPTTKPKNSSPPVKPKSNFIQPNSDDGMSSPPPLEPVPLPSHLSPRPTPPSASPTRQKPATNARDVMLDKDFFEFSNAKLRPGGRVHRSDIVQAFLYGFCEKYKGIRHHNPDLYRIPSELDTELLLFRWNDQYAKAQVDADGFYNGFHLVETTTPTASSSLTTSRAMLHPQPSVSTQQPQPPQSPTTVPKEKPSSTLRPLPVQKLAEIAVKASATGGRIAENLTDDDVLAVNFQLEQVMLAKSLQESAAASKHQKEKEEADAKQKAATPALPWAPAAPPAKHTPTSSQQSSSAPVLAPTPTPAPPSAQPISPSARPNLAEIDTVEELVLNGFERSRVVQAYEIFGDNFDELVSFLMSTQ